MYSAESYTAASKLTKPAWGIILGVGVAAQIVLGGVIGLITLPFTIAAWCTSPTCVRRWRR